MKRKAMRARAVVLLDTLSGYTITDNSGLTVNKDQVPRIDVQWGEEQQADDQQPLDGTGIYDVVLNLVVTNRGAGIQDFIDDTVYSVRELFRTDHTLNGNAIHAQYIATDEPELSREGDALIVSFVISIGISYAE